MRWQVATVEDLLHTCPMRQAFACEAVLIMAADADMRAPGAAITVALCGHWEHEPPCPLAPHYSNAERVGDEVRIRVLFATDPEQVGTVHARIDMALSKGRLDGPAGGTTTWQLCSSRPSAVRAEESDHAQRLVNS